jgi:hypothetical protein
MSGRTDEDTTVKAGSTVLSIAMAIGAFCALMLYAFVSGQLKDLPAQISSNNSTTAMIGEPRQ